MKKMIQNMWIRMIACVMCAISVLGMLGSIAGLFFFAEYPKKEILLNQGYKKLMENYAFYGLDHLEDEDLDDFFHDTNMYLTISNVSYESEEATEPTITALYSNMPSGYEVTHQLEGIAWNVIPVYETEYLGDAFNAHYYANAPEGMVCTDIVGYVLDVKNGLFYYETPDGYFSINCVDVVTDDGIYTYYLSTLITGEKGYVEPSSSVLLDTSRYMEWSWIAIDGVPMGVAQAVNGLLVRVEKDASVLEEYVRDESCYTNENQVFYLNSRSDVYRVEMALKEEFTEQDLLLEYQELIEVIYTFQNYVRGILVGSIILFVVGLLLLIVSATREKEKISVFHKVPVLIFTAMAVIVEWLLGSIAYLLIRLVAEYDDLTVTYEEYLWIGIPFGFIMALVGMIYVANMVTRIKTRTLYRYSECYYISKPILFIYRFAKENLPLFWKGVIGVGTLTLVEFIVLFLLNKRFNGTMACFLLIKLLESSFLIYVIAQMKLLQEGAKRVATGNWSKPIDTSKMFWEFQKHGENINQVGDGIAVAVEEQLKSERFKTELITNVSHDIKTPLTSIINYVDLLKKEEIENEKYSEYIEVLERQSARLKKLIEDLMEASKASTGNLAVNMEECDIKVLLTQVVGEFEDKLEKSSLNVVVDQTDISTTIMADGRHVWRVFENLMNNICKYSQENTRVYVSLDRDESGVCVIFKNISKNPLNIPSDQLMQRFVRGDSSRHTEGSGLGLSIAQSLMELMNGTMKLDIDGDLFKVTLKFKAVID